MMAVTPWRRQTTGWSMAIRAVLAGRLVDAGCFSPAKSRTSRTRTSTSRQRKEQQLPLLAREDNPRRCFSLENHWKYHHGSQQQRSYSSLLSQPRPDGDSGRKRPMYAILVDAENAQYATVENIMKEIVSLGGDASVRRVYGDFTKPTLGPWKQIALQHSFLPVNAFSYATGKGSSDAAMIMEAMELLFTNPTIGGYALVSSDSDFTRLAQRLREAGKHVIGFGQRKTPVAFVTACERFIYTENLIATPVEQKPLHEGLPKDLLNTMQKIIEDKSEEDGWMKLSCLGESVTAVKSDFDVRSYGYKKLKMLILDCSDFELRLQGDKLTYDVRNRPCDHQSQV